MKAVIMAGEQRSLVSSAENCVPSCSTARLALALDRSWARISILDRTSRSTMECVRIDTEVEI